MATEVLPSQGAPRATSRLALDMTVLGATALLLLVSFVVLYPIMLLIINSFRVGPLGQQNTWGLENWSIALSHPRILDALSNTMTLAVTRQGIAVFFGVFIAWVLARTNLPGRNWLEVVFWFSTLIPTLPILLGWILLLDGHYGILLKGIQQVFPDFHFEIFSWWGIVVTHLLTGLVSVKVFLLTPAFRNMDASLEEAARTSGASPIRTVFQIVLPLMFPAIAFTTLLGLIRSMQSFEIELVLGGAAGIDVYSTLIYRQIQQAPPQYGQATALSMIILGSMVPLILGQQWLVGRRNFTTVSGKYTNRLFDLGPLRWPLFALLAGSLFVVVVLPISFMVLGTFMTQFGNFNLPQPYTMRNWERILKDSQLLRALTNTLIICMASTALSVSLFTLIAYVSLRTKFFGRRILDFVTWLPSTVPGIVTSLGWLWFVLGTPVFKGLYGTTWILILALGFSGMTLGVQLIRNGLIQLGQELEEGSWAAGAGWLYTMRRILLPLIAPSVAVVALTHFGASASAVSLIALLGSNTNKTLSLLQLEYFDTSLFEPASVIGVIIFLLTVGAALLAQRIGLSAGLGRQQR